jgi:hypothetical protein
MNIKKNIAFLYLIVSLIYVGFLIGYSNLNPLSLDWLFIEPDLISYYLPWHFYGSSDWSLNLFKNFNYGLEVSENLFFADNVQLINILLKPIKKILGFNFQYLSFWYLICVTLQGYFAFKIIHHKTKNEVYSFIAGLFFIILPFFLDRLFIHISLGAHWLILWAIYLQIKYTPSQSQKKWSYLIAISFFININISLIIVLYLYFYLSFLFFLKKINLSSLFYFYIYFLILIATFLLLCGFFTINMMNFPDFGYGYYKSNLLSLIDSKGGINGLSWSTIFSDFKHMPGEEEGFSYLGTSVYLVLFHFKLKNNLIQNYLFYILIILFFLLLSLTNKINFGEYLLIDFTLNKYLFGLFSILRSSGRFIWIPAYLILIFTFFSYYDAIKNKKIQTLILIILLCLQLFDQNNALFNLRSSFQDKTKNNFNSVFWNKISKNYPFYRTSFVLSDSTGVGINGKIIVRGNFKGTNINYLSRIDRRNLAQSRYNNYNKIYKKEIDTNSIYWIHPNHLINIFFLYKDNKNFKIFRLNNSYYILRENNNLDSIIEKNQFISKIKYPEIILNKKFNAQKNKSFFGMGWLYGASFWSDGPMSSILFAKNNEVKKLILVTDIFNYNQKTIKNFEFFLNDKLLNNVAFKYESNSYIIEIPLSKEILKDSNHLLIKNNNTLTRADITIYPDPRLLGIKIKEFYFN